MSVHMGKLMVPAALLAGLLLLVYALCDDQAAAPAGQGTAAEAPVSPVDSLVLQVGQSRMTVLESQAGTGYCWQLAEELPVDAPVTVMLDQGVCKDENCCGFPVPVTLTLSGQKPGKALLRFIYARPWEKGKTPLREQIYAVEVLP